MDGDMSSTIGLTTAQPDGLADRDQGAHEAVGILCSEDFLPACRAAGWVAPLTINEAMLTPTLTQPFYGAVVKPEDRDRLENFARRRNLDIVIRLVEDAGAVPAVLGAIMGAALSRQGALYIDSLRQGDGLQRELERCERRLLEVEKFLRQSGIGTTQVVFNNSGDDAILALTISASSVAIGARHLAHASGFSMQLPVPLELMSCIQLEGVEGQIGNGVLHVSLTRRANGAPLASWRVTNKDIPVDCGPLNLYLPVELADETVTVDLRLHLENLSARDKISFSLASPTGDGNGHIHLSNGEVIAQPLQIKILKGLPFQRSTPFLGCIFPEDTAHEHDFVEVSRETLLSAKPVWPSRPAGEMTLVGEETYIHTGLLVHPVENDLSIAHIDLASFDLGAGEMRFNLVNDGEKSAGILFSAIASEKPLAGKSLKQAFAGASWIRVGALERAIQTLAFTAGSKNIYMATRSPEDCSTDYGWFLITNIAVFPAGAA